MLPLLTFATGIVAGVVGVRMLKTVKASPLDVLTRTARAGLDRAGEELRDATMHGLGAIERSSAGLRAKLAADQERPTAANVETPAATAAVAVRTRPSRKRRHEKAS